MALAAAAASIIIIRLFLTRRVTSWVDFWVCMSSELRNRSVPAVPTVPKEEEEGDVGRTPIIRWCKFFPVVFFCTVYIHLWVLEGQLLVFKIIMMAEECQARVCFRTRPKPLPMPKQANLAAL